MKTPASLALRWLATGSSPSLLRLFLCDPLASSKRVRRNAPGISQPHQSDQLEGGGLTQLYTIRQSGIAGILRCRCRVEFLGDVPSVESESGHVGDVPSVESESGHVGDECFVASFLDTRFSSSGTGFSYRYCTPARERFVVRIEESVEGGSGTMKACLFVVEFNSSSRRYVERSLAKALSTSHKCVSICVCEVPEKDAMKQTVL